MRFLVKLFGLGLLIAGIYFLGKNIIFTTQISQFWRQDLAAAGSVLLLSLGVVGLVLFPRASGLLAWGAIAIGILLVFLSGKVSLRPTSLWYFFVSFTCLVSGFKLMATGRLPL
ncbi:MAG: hypothetical protein HC890_04165 [Chloroflexaceae bacterium]|nr:hypothetical protein [Chloroflexaceae bacterium]